MEEVEEDREQRVTPLELFFDLVVVFGVTQVTTLLVDRPTPGGLLRGALLLAVLWWGWAGYAWLTNTVDPEEGGVRIAVFAAMGGMLVVALAAPGAFGRDAITFGVAYFMVRVLLLVLFGFAGRGDPYLFRNILRIAPAGIIGPSLIIAAAFFDGGIQLAIWGAALAIEYLGVLVQDIGAWRLSPDHLAERYGLVIIIALGESVFAIGIGVSGLHLSASVLVAALLGIVVVAMLWWLYFDWVSLAARAHVAELAGAAQSAFARDAYSYLHLPMVAGIVLFAFGLETTLHNVESSLEAVPATGLYGGVALYLLGHIGLRLRSHGGIGRGRPAAAVLLVGLLPVAMPLPALAALVLVTSICIALVAYEALRHREARAFIRSHRGVFATEEALAVENNDGRGSAEGS